MGYQIINWFKNLFSKENQQEKEINKIFNDFSQKLYSEDYWISFDNLYNNHHTLSDEEVVREYLHILFDIVPYNVYINSSRLERMLRERNIADIVYDKKQERKIQEKIRQRRINKINKII